MARVTVEDCIDKVENRFDLVLLASHRARMISSGSQITIDRDNDKNPVVALREIAEKTISPDDLREELVHSLQKYVEVDEPEPEAAPLITAAGGKSVVSVRLIHVPDKKSVPGAIIIQMKADMGPDGMADMTAPVQSAPPKEPGIYLFEIQPGMAGKWMLTLAAKVQGEIRMSHFPWPCCMALLGRSREPPCDPYHCTFGLVVTASVHPQLSGTRSLSPDEPRIRDREPAAARAVRSGRFSKFMSLCESNHGTQNGKNGPVH